MSKNLASKSEDISEEAYPYAFSVGGNYVIFAKYISERLLSPRTVFPTNDSGELRGHYIFLIDDEFRDV